MYQIVYGLLYLLSFLPWFVIYLLSDFIFLILYYIVRYRRGVVAGNLLIAFPEKTEAERNKIARQFYRQFTDNFIEVIKMLSISEKELNRRFAGDFSVVNSLYDSGINIQLHLGHFFNWEFANLAISHNIRYPFVVVYMPVTNKIFNRLFMKVRSRFGSKLVAATNFKNEFLPYTKSRYMMGLVGDQNPGGPDAGYWTTFFNKLTPIVKGPEKGARVNNAAIVMCKFYPVKRGFYEIKFELLTTDPRSLPKGEITKKMLAFIEAAVREHPASYLWSHRRWKWQYDEKYNKLII